MPTRTQRVVAQLQREWKYTAVCIGACVFAGFGSIWLWAHEHMILAALLGLTIIPVSFAALFVKRAPCPRCGNPITIIGIDQCEHCREYIRIDGNALKIVEVGYVAEYPIFQLDVPLSIIPRLGFPSDGCCVCGGVVSVEETLDIQQTIISIPHCTEHEHGVIWSLGMGGGEATTNVTFKFRGFDYWKAVRQTNWVHVRAGMWR